MKYHRKCAFVTFLFLALLGSLHAGSLPLVNQSLAPTSVPPGSPAFVLTVHGTGFTATSVVNWNGQPRATGVLSASTLQASISAADVAKAGTASVTVSNLGGFVSSPVFFPVTTPSAKIAMAGKQVFANCGAAVAGDFNGDGKLDVAWADSNLETVYISFGNGKGGFLAPIPNAIGGIVLTSPVVQMIAEDFNGDGKLDLAVIDFDGVAEVLLGNGDGTFNLATTFARSGVGSVIASADFNQNGNLDLYLTGRELGPSWFDIYFGDGAGGFSLFQQYLVNALGVTEGLPAIGDFTGNGKLDLIVPENNPNNGQLYLGNGDGTFVASNIVGGQLAALAADFNQDGKLDFITESGCTLLGNGDGTFVNGGCGGFTGNGITGVGDFNGDGILDAAVPLFQSPYLSINLGKGDGTFQSSWFFPAGGVAVNLFSFGSVADFNGDGKLDVITGTGFLLLQTTANLSTTSLAFGNQNVGASSPVQSVTLTNIGSGALPLQASTITGTNAADYSKTTTCAASLAAGASCTISVKFAPKAAGSRTALLNVKYTGVGSPQSVSLGGVGVTPPSASLAPASLAFATRLVGTTSPAQTATLTNTGTLVVNISKIALPLPFHQTNNCPPALAGGATCQILVTFAPTARGAFTGKLSVTSNAIRSPQAVALTGTGTVVTISPIGVNFGVQKLGVASTSVPVTLTDGGTGSLSISQIAVTGTDAGDFSQANNCGSTLAGKKSCTISLVFRPTATGARSANLSISDNGGASPQAIPIGGTGN